MKTTAAGFMLSRSRSSALSGTTDTLPVLAPLELLEQTPAAGGDTLCVTGQIRSYNNREPEGRRLVISVLAETMTLCSAAHDNRAELLGTTAARRSIAAHRSGGRSAT